MTLHTTFQIGRLKAHALESGYLRLDGGSMFGVVPKTLWQKYIIADQRNRIRLAMRCLLLEHPDGLVLIDTGLGNKEDSKFLDIFGVDNAGTDHRTRLEDAIKAAGHGVADVRWVINTHLHFDHAGGNTWKDHMGEINKTFPRATYVVQRREYEFATHTNERTKGSYFPLNWDQIDLTLLDGEQEILPGIKGMPTPGHTPGHQSILIQSDGDKLLFIADLVPTASHLPIAWIMGYDVEPLVTLETRRHLYPRAEAEGWRLFFEHDATTIEGRLEKAGKGFALVAPVTLG
ncbi:MAG TPA: MBL fold metallo-hydrolase [Gemmatimonadales bacterium]|nr:MBL fold metallo-hydrolase [Gemmatimonadales bacterium]